MKISFHPFYENSKLIEATGIYQNIWNSEGEKIVKVIECCTGLKFTQKNINAIVFEGVSQSDPLALRASYDEDTKKQH
jgi:hypothetical protein